MDFFDFSAFHIYIGIFLSITNAIILSYVAYNFFQVLQLSGYSVKGYFTWLKESRFKRVSDLIMLCFISMACLVVTNVLFSDFQSQGYWCYLGLIFYYVMCFVYIKNIEMNKQKTPLKYTRRMNRLIATFFVIMSALTFVLIMASFQITNIFRMSIVAVTPVLVTLIIPVINFINYPFEKLIALFYINHSKKILKSMPNLIKIGITGSYGKTSTKFILNTILSEKYKVCSSPSSFNTPMGLCKTIREHLKQNHEVLICEMGAVKKGEIKELVEFINPQFSILTSVGNQHLNTFKTIDNIKSTKYEIVKYLQVGGTAVLNCNNSFVEGLSHHETPNKTIIKTGFDASYNIYASDIKVSSQGTEFTIHFDKKSLVCKTKLLGIHNIENILMSVAIAKHLNLTDSQIKAGILKLQSIPHRLEIINATGGITILDDSFNASVEGVKSALDVLKLFKANRKIVITPGIVDLGKEEYMSNYVFGQQLANVADLVIIVNNRAKQALVNGLISENYEDSKIKQFDSLRLAQDYLETVIEEKDVLLIENDLPDNYI